MEKIDQFNIGKYQEKVDEYNPEEIKKYGDMNEDMEKAEEMITPEQAKMSKERLVKMIDDDVSREAYRQAEEMKPYLREQLQKIVREDKLTNEYINSVAHEYEKLLEIKLKDVITYSGFDNYSDRKISAYGGYAGRGEDIFNRLLEINIKPTKDSIKNINDKIDPERYGREAARIKEHIDRYNEEENIKQELINALSEEDDQKIENILKKPELVSVESESSLRNLAERVQEARLTLKAWANGRFYVGERQYHDDAERKFVTMHSASERAKKGFIGEILFHGFAIQIAINEHPQGTAYGKDGDLLCSCCNRDRVFELLGWKSNDEKIEKNKEINQESEGEGK